MKTILPAITLLAAAPLAAQPLTIERIFSDPGLAGAKLRAPTFSPDGKLVTFLQGRSDDANRLDLWAYDVASGKLSRLVDSDDLHKGAEQLSDEEKARRERQRLFASGIVEYHWSHDGKALLFPLAGDLYYYDLASRKARQLTKTDAFELDAKFSPDDKKVSFIRDQDIFVLDLASGQEQALTQDGQGPIKNGMAEFVAQEEMGRLTGYWWAPDSQQIAFLQVDETPVPEVVRNEIYADRIDFIQQRYPAAGDHNVTLKLGVVSIAGDQVRWFDTGDNKDIYIPRVAWSNDSSLLTYQWQSRDQHQLELRGIDPKTGASQVLVKEEAKTWVNLNNDLRFLKEDNSLIWASERSGFKHLYRLKDGALKPLTQGDWQVEALAKVDEANGWLYFTGWVSDPKERQLYRTRLDGSTAAKPQQVSVRPGWHAISFSKDGGHYLDLYSSLDQPPQVSLHSSDGTPKAYLVENRLDAKHPLAPYLKDWVKPQYGTLQAEDGKSLQYRVFKPSTPMPEGGYPAIVRVYGGPTAQLVVNAWSDANLWTQYMVSRGYVVFQLDNRGSENRGKAFEDVIYQHLGEIELHDQVLGANWLKAQGYVDGGRVGIYGHSYGGYMTLMAMFKAGDTFAAGVSGAPVTDWGLYDTHYTERYLNTPQANGKGYEASSVFPYSKDLKGELLIYHGMADDNVLFTNTTKLIKQLQDQGKLFEFMAYPGAKHSLYGKETRIHQYKTITRFFDRTLGQGKITAPNQ
ncbi:DPP IV N-terminal domain-containing protein [Gallaecimonas xiamenensis]|uniref:Dipeptidyl peptidase IV n=1 Tax=Gallaecimonas xiamenensis 3-C-1 TaxID=745411 RepID=K2JPS4_9GAMM|nr:DPP IV N-terminal domain-containing protein [Gallaecimonas xiamenensis]EKE67235.1 dipeptidyl peptidase IV [Gallaecimonas xiamenensis 3-C-1]